MDREPALLEKEAHILLEEGKTGEAHTLYKKAGEIYKKMGAHKEAALCLSSAATCWALKSGERTFHNSSAAYEEAAAEAEAAGDLEYASLLYRQAAINFERDMEFSSFSESLYRSRECLRKFLLRSLTRPRDLHHITSGGTEKGRTYSIFRRSALWVFLTLSSLVWGHGERPNRAFYATLAVILLSAAAYTQGSLIKGDIVFRPGLPQALYFSVITFTTVGYGDVTPVGPAKLVAMSEVLCAIFIVPLFIISLSRKYLRT